MSILPIHTKKYNFVVKKIKDNQRIRVKYIISLILRFRTAPVNIQHSVMRQIRRDQNIVTFMRRFSKHCHIQKNKENNEITPNTIINCFLLLSEFKKIKIFGTLFT